MHTKSIFNISSNDKRGRKCVELSVTSDYIIFSKEKIDDEDVYRHAYKHPEIWNQLIKIKIKDIRKISIVENKLEFKGWNYVEDRMFIYTGEFEKTKDISQFSEVFSQSTSWKPTTSQENKWIGMLQSGGAWAVVSGSIMGGLLISGHTDLDLGSSGRAKKRIVGKLVELIIHFVGINGSIVLCIVSILLALYFMYRKFQNPSDKIVFTPS